MRTSAVIIIALFATCGCSADLVVKDDDGHEYLIPKSSIALISEIKASTLKARVKEEISLLTMNEHSFSKEFSGDLPTRFPLVNTYQLRRLQIEPLLEISDKPDLIAKNYEYLLFQLNSNGVRRPVGKQHGLCFSHSRNDSASQKNLIASFVDKVPYKVYVEPPICSYAFNHQ